MEKPKMLKLGADYETAWARKPLARRIRKLMIQNITRPVVHLVASPKIVNADRLADLEAPVIFAVNHSSHLDTSLVLTALPPHLRHTTAVAARSDYFFDKHWKAFLWSLWMNVIPLERDKANRQSVQAAQDILQSGWSLVIYPEGTRGEDDFVGPFRAGAAYLSVKTGIPIVPIHLEGTRNIFTPYTRRIRFGYTRVTFGTPMNAFPDERPRDFNVRLEAAVAQAADEGRTDWWGARLRAATGKTPSLQGPDGVKGWRKTWASASHSIHQTNDNWPNPTRSK